VVVVKIGNNLQRLRCLSHRFGQLETALDNNKTPRALSFNRPFSSTSYDPSFSLMPTVAREAWTRLVKEENMTGDVQPWTFLFGQNVSIIQCFTDKFTSLPTLASRMRPNMFRNPCTPFPTALVYVSNLSTASIASSSSRLKAG
jgi:hypothetical protein